jgi:uncharacterized protein
MVMAAERRERALGIFAKWPAPGQVKTRLALSTSATWAAQVASAFLEDTLGRVAVLDVRRLLVFSPPQSEAFFAGITRGRASLVPQGDGDLGARLERFILRELTTGPVVVIGTDSPTLPLGHIEDAFVALEEADVVLGPATDGGYYLIGCRRPVPSLFAGIDWGGERVLTQSVQRLDDPAWRLAVLPPWYDVDSLEDWRMLCGHLFALRRAGMDPGVPRTEALAREDLS